MINPSGPIDPPMNPRVEKRIGVLGSPESWYFRDLQRASLTLPNARIELQSISYSDLSIGFMGGPAPRVQSVAERPRNSDPSNDGPERVDLSGLDTLLVRSMPIGSLEQTIVRMDILHAMHQRGIDVRNVPRCLEIAIDKWRTLDVAHRHGIEIPRTWCCQTREDSLQAFEMLGGDCVVKPIFGGEGRGIVRVSDRDMAWRVFSTLEQLRSVMYIQEFLESDGFDLRILVIGEDVLCVRREMRGDWRSNIARGGVAVSHEPTFEQVSIAYKACKSIEGWMIGVDILQTRDGRNVLLELNAVPGWKGTAAALDVDIAQLVLQRLLEVR